MKAVSFYQSLPIADPQSLVDVAADPPRPQPRDLLIEVRAISVNPVDTKIRVGGGPGRPDGQLQILGWDTAGVVKEVGNAVSLFRSGDEVYYAGSVDRAGSYAELQCVDERIVAPWSWTSMPKTPTGHRCRRRAIVRPRERRE